MIKIKWAKMEQFAIEISLFPSFSLKIVGISSMLQTINFMYFLFYFIIYTQTNQHSSWTPSPLYFISK